MGSCKPVTTKIINSPETCVDDNLRGVVALYPTLQLHPKHRVVTLRREDDSGRVAILGGGGSGHEPFAAGLIGQGMLDGAVAGGVFASPPTGHVLYAITQLYKYNTGGVLVLLGNYTGDRLNFGKAFEKAKIAGIKVEGFIVGEDVASSHNKTGGRSMCGEVFLYKMCGAMSANGCDIQSIRNMAEKVNKNMATLGICLTACSLPGQPPLFEISPGEMEVGAGVHGEAGVEKREMVSAKTTVGLIMDQIVAHLKLTAGNTVAAMINNMGGTSLLEMNIVAAEIKDYLQLKQMKMERLYSGHFKTSLEMHGFQICFLNLSHQDGEKWLQLLDAPTTAGGWTGGEMSKGEHGVHEDDDTLLTTDDNEMVSGPILSNHEQQILRENLQAACEELVKNEELLNRLDSGCGDGDCGITLKKFALAVVGDAPLEGPQRAARVLWRLADLAETDMGGTSGGLYSLGLSAASVAMAGYVIYKSQNFYEEVYNSSLRVSNGYSTYSYTLSGPLLSAITNIMGSQRRATANDRHAWLSALESAIAAISKYGGAEPGDRTMLDPLHRMSEAFKQNVNAEFKTLLQVIVDAAEQGAKDTASMTAKAGRASYVSAGRTRGEDAGARAVALWTRAIATSLRPHHTH